MNLKKKQIVPTVHLERDFFFFCTKAQQMDTNVQSEKADKVGDTAQLMTLDFFFFFFSAQTPWAKPSPVLWGTINLSEWFRSVWKALSVTKLNATRWFVPLDLELNPAHRLRQVLASATHSAHLKGPQPSLYLITPKKKHLLKKLKVRQVKRSEVCEEQN